MLASILDCYYFGLWLGGSKIHSRVSTLYLAFPIVVSLEFRFDHIWVDPHFDQQLCLPGFSHYLAKKVDMHKWEFYKCIWTWDVTSIKNFTLRKRLSQSTFLIPRTGSGDHEYNFRLVLWSFSISMFKPSGLLFDCILHTKLCFYNIAWFPSLAELKKSILSVSMCLYFIT